MSKSAPFSFDHHQGYQGQGKVRQFCKKSWKIFDVVKVIEKSGNVTLWLMSGNLYAQSYQLGWLW